MLIADDPRLINVASRVKELEKQVSDIEWDHGVDDPRLPPLRIDLDYFRAQHKNGVLYEPMF